MKFLSFANIAILSLLITVNPFSLISKVEAQDLNTDELKSTNLGCTNSLKTVLGQRSPDYCTSSEANSGILFDKFEATRNSDRSINLNLRVFNRGSADGLIEVYDSSQRLQDIKIIDGNRPPTGFLQSGGELLKVPASLFSRYPLGDSRKNLQEQNISIKIPAGGSIKVSKSSSYALRYNTIMLAIEVAQLVKGDSEYTKSNSRKEVIIGFIKDTIFSRDSKTAINIFKSEPTTNALFSLDFIDKDKLAIFLQQILKYSVTIENDPSKNPFVGAIFDVTTDLGNIGIEKAIDYLGLGLGNLVRAIRIGGSGVNTYARAVDLFNATASGQKSTVTLRDAKSFNTGLTSQQKTLIDATGIKIVVPDYIPTGFQVYEVKVVCPECRGRNSPRGPGYGIIYRDSRDTCFAIEGFEGGRGGGLPWDYVYPVRTQLFGDVQLTFSDGHPLNRKPRNYQYGKTPSKQQKNLPQPFLYTDWVVKKPMRAGYRLIGADFVSQSYYGARRNQPASICRNDITPLDAEKIIKSLRWLD